MFREPFKKSGQVPRNLAKVTKYIAVHKKILPKSNKSRRRYTIFNRLRKSLSLKTFTQTPKKNRLKLPEQEKSAPKMHPGETKKPSLDPG